MPIFLSTIFVFITGCIIGSFIGSLSYRLPKAILNDEDDILKAISVPRSYCTNCQQSIPTWQLIPIISWFANKGTARCCNTKINKRYIIIESAMGLLAVAGYLLYGFSPQLLASITLSFLALTLLIIDLETLLLPDQLTLGGTWLGLLFCWYITPEALASHVWGAVIGYGVLWLIYQIHYRITHREGMGYGDFKLLAMLGAWNGLMALPLTLLIASLCAIISYPLLKNNRLANNGEIPFGPALCIAGWVMYHFGDKLINLIYGA